METIKKNKFIHIEAIAQSTAMPFTYESKTQMGKLLRINSVDAMAGSASKSDFTVDLGTDISTERMTRCVLKSIIFPHVFYNVNSGNQIFTFIDDVTTRAVTRRGSVSCRLGKVWE